MKCRNRWSVVGRKKILSVVLYQFCRSLFCNILFLILEWFAENVIMHCFICPTYGQYDYARAAVKSFLQHTPGGVALVVDDGHPQFHKFWDDHWNVVAHRFRGRGGLTRSWNYGLKQARKMGAEYAI